MMVHNLYIAGRVVLGCKNFENHCLRTHHWMFVKPEMEEEAKRTWQRTIGSRNPRKNDDRQNEACLLRLVLLLVIIIEENRRKSWLCILCVTVFFFFLSMQKTSRKTAENVRTKEKQKQATQRVPDRQIQVQNMKLWKWTASRSRTRSGKLARTTPSVP